MSLLEKMRLIAFGCGLGALVNHFVMGVTPGMNLACVLLVAGASWLILPDQP